jgi:hypothetical protein
MTYYAVPGAVRIAHRREATGPVGANDTRRRSEWIDPSYISAAAADTRAAFDK